VRRPWIVAAAVATLSSCLGLVALAQPVEIGKEGELANILPPQPGTQICYARQYSAEHLQAHPKQTVTAVEFRLTYYSHEPDEYYKDGQRNYYFALRARQRGSDRWSEGLGECVANGDGISCGIDCDGGGILAKRRGADKLLVYFGHWPYIRMGGCGGGDEGNAGELTPGEDDKEFLLDKTSAAACPVYEDW